MSAKCAAAVVSTACQPPEVLPNADGSVSFKYNARDSGLHELAVLHNERPIPGALGPLVRVHNSGAGVHGIVFVGHPAALFYSHSYSAGVLPSGGPFKAIVESIGGGRVTAFGAGLTAARCGQATEFTVLLRNANKSVLGANEMREND